MTISDGLQMLKRLVFLWMTPAFRFFDYLKGASPPLLLRYVLRRDAQGRIRFSKKYIFRFLHIIRSENTPRHMMREASDFWYVSKSAYPKR